MKRSLDFVLSEVTENRRLGWRVKGADGYFRNTILTATVENNGLW